MSRTVNDMATDLEASIAALEAEKAVAPRSERRPINQRLHLQRGLLAWVKSRTGYAETPADLGLLDRGEAPDGR